MRITKQLILSVLAVFSVITCLADTLPIDQSTYTVHKVSSFMDTKPVENAFDNDMATYWGIQNAKWAIPVSVIIDLGEEKAVAGISYLPNGKSSATRRAKATYFEVYVSNDTLSFPIPEKRSMFVWENLDDSHRQDIYFGAKNGRYVKVVYKNNYVHLMDPDSDNYGIHTNDLVVYENTDGAESKINPLININEVGSVGTVQEPFEIVATTDSDQPISFEVVNGPATIIDNICTLTGEVGIVSVKASVSASDNFCSTESYMAFKVIDVSVFTPEISTSLTGDYPIFMNELKPFPITVKIEGLPSYISENTNIYIGEDILSAKKVDGGYMTYWKPANYGFQVITIECVAGNGNSDSKSFPINVTPTTSNITVPTMDRLHMNSSTAKTNSYTLPQFVGTYNQIIGHFSLNFPNDDPNSVDIWDRVSRIWVRNNSSDWIEIIRYITPYKTECDHQLDLTDYASLLQGNVEIMAWVETNGKGFDFSLDIEYIAGEPEYDYSQVTKVWNGRYNFGNYNNLQPVGKKSIVIDSTMVNAKLNLVTTGHGWCGNNDPNICNNTSNAAEFFPANHTINVNEASFNQYLWTETCYPNPDGCSPQYGQWQGPRAGWCPGAIATLYQYDLSDLIDTSDVYADTLVFEYIFDDYVDECHPNYPGCENQETGCTDCNAGANPNYIVSANVISQFKETPEFKVGVFNPELPITELGFSVYPSISCGELFINAEFESDEIVVEIIGLNGASFRNYAFENSFSLNNYMFDLNDLESGFYIVRISTQKGYGARKFIIE